MKKTKKHLIHLIIALAITSFSTNALACECESTDIDAASAWQNNDLVFTGMVTRITKTGNLHNIILSADRAWKGVSQERVTLAADTDDWSCDYQFEELTHYLVFAKLDSTQKPRASICSLTGTLSESQHHINALGNAKSVKGVINTPADQQLLRVRPNQGHYGYRGPGDPTLGAKIRARRLREKGLLEPGQ